MATTYVWQFQALDVYPSYAGYSNVVRNMHWRLVADDGAGHTARAYGTQLAGALNPAEFIPFASLTLATVTGWCEQQMGAAEVAAVKAGLDAQIAQQVSPTTQSLAPPWGG